MDEVCRFKYLHVKPSRLDLYSSNLDSVTDKHVDKFRPAISRTQNPTKRDRMLIGCQGLRDDGQRRSINLVQNEKSSEYIFHFICSIIH
jgi:hypothetical protein